MISSHPRAKLPQNFWVTGEAPLYPGVLRDTEWFRSDQWIGAAFSNWPTDLSEQRLCEKRCFSVLDDMNNWGNPK